jgi:glycosyltransferase involved in cell wall biosynthesis
MSPLVSIGLITYNRADIIHLAIEQLLGQTYRNIELIISDNASTDNTQEVCARYIRTDRRVRYFRQKENIGMYGNFNFVLEQAKGVYFLWATDDDEWHPHFIQTLVSLHQTHPSAVVAGCNYRLMSDTKHFDVDYRFDEYTEPLTSIKNGMATGPIISYGLHRTDLLRKTGGFYYYPRFIPTGIGESLLVYRVLLQGGVAFCCKRLWRKRDSGYSFDRYEVLKKDISQSHIRMRILRYLKLPLLFHYDLIIMMRDTWRSGFSLKQKLVLIYWCIRMYFTFCVEYVKTLWQGGVIFLKSRLIVL